MNQRDRIVIADDAEVNRAILSELFSSTYKVMEADNGDEALSMIYEYQDSIAAVLMDIVMPGRDGFQVLDELKKQKVLDKIPVIVITSENSSQSEVRAFDLGASDIIMKPFETFVVKRRVHNITELYRHRLHLEELVQEQARSLRESKDAMIDALSSVIEHRSLESGQHIRRIRLFTKILLKEVAVSCPEYWLDESKIEMISSAASMHDIGKIAIPDAVLNKPGRLTEEEYEIMKTHALKGCEILMSLGRISDKEYLKYAYDICRHHHERWDGKGYPDGLRGDSIPVCAQVVGIADAYDALTTERVYKEAYSHKKSVEMIMNGECGLFSPKLLQCFQRVLKEFETLAEVYSDGFEPFEGPKEEDVIGTWMVPDDKRTDGSRYFAVLKYLNANVFELNQADGSCRIVYASNSDLKELGSQPLFAQGLERFVKENVIPEEREGVLRWFEEQIPRLFHEGRDRFTLNFRMYEPGESSLLSYQADILRLDIPDAGQKRALLVFSRTEWQDTQREIGTKSAEAGNGSDRRAALDGKSGSDDSEGRDVLTGLPGKALVKNRIERFLQESGKDVLHALFIVDLDDFRIINDSYGHLMGDRMLARIADKIYGQFRGTDIVGRIGGDEFVILLTGLKDRSAADKRASLLIRSLNEIDISASQKYDFSSSIGISVYPQDGVCFDELFRKAGTALYTAKHSGKGQYRYYLDLPDQYRPETAKMGTDGSRREGGGGPKTDFEESLFRLYFSFRDDTAAMDAVIDAAARKFRLNHVFAYEITEPDLKCGLYEWNADAAIRYKNVAGNMNLGDGLLMQEFLNDGMLCCPDTGMLPERCRNYFERLDYTAVLSVTITDENGNRCGFAGFSERDGAREWTQEEKSCLRLIARLTEIGSIRKRRTEYLEQRCKALLEVFYRMPGKAFIIDDSFRILHVNEEALKTGGAVEGDKCYAALQGKSASCSDCPVKKLNRSRNTYESGVFVCAWGRGCRIRVREISWTEGKKAYLLTAGEEGVTDHG